MENKIDNKAVEIYGDYLFHKAIPRLNELEARVQHQEQIIKQLEHSFQNSRSIILANKLKKIVNKFKLNNKSATQPIPYDSLYDHWVKKNQLSDESCSKMKVEADIFSYKPKISIVMPVYNVSEKWLKIAVDSVLKQIYTNWELCIVDDASTENHIKPLLLEISKLDTRIKVEFSNINEHISATSNKGISLSTGEFVTFLDNDDEIPKEALFEVVKVLNQNKNLDLIYSDEDQITLKGKRVNPIFKPDWSEEMIMSMMYTTHLSIYRKAILDKIKGFRVGYEGSQDYDLVLRASEVIKKENIYHIPKVLYHWRRVPGSTSRDYFAKPYARTNAKRSIEDALKRREIDAIVEEGLTPSTFRVKRIIKDNPKVSIIIPTKDNVHLVYNSIFSILNKSTYKNFEIILISNNSSEDSVEKFKFLEKNGIKLFEFNNPFNYSEINNFGVSKSSGEHLLFLNNDIEIINSDWIESMLEFSQLPEIGAVGAKLLYPNNTIQHAGVLTSLDVPGHAHRFFSNEVSGYLGRINVIQNFLAVTAACLMVKRKIFDEVKGFNTDLKVAFNDVDLCLKIFDKGYRNVYTPHAQAYHFESQSRGQDVTKEQRERFDFELNLLKTTWPGYTANDPFYNPNLTKEFQDFRVRI